MEIREKVVTVLREAQFRSYVKFKQQRRTVALAAFDGADEATLREVKHHIRSVRYAEVCPPFFRRSEDLYASELLASAPDNASSPVDYTRFIRGACVAMLSFAGVRLSDMPSIRVEDINLSARTVFVAGHRFTFSRMTAFIIEEFLRHPIAFRPHGAAWHVLEERCDTYLFSTSKDEPVKVNELHVAVREMKERTSEHGFVSDAYLAALNGDFVRARARIDRGEDREAVFDDVLRSAVETRDRIAFSETYDAFVHLCP